jgi:hypothetical protein
VTATFRFRPRYRALAVSAIGVGGTLGIAAIALLGGALVPLATGLAGVALGAGYLVSPTWKLRVIVDDDGLEVRSPRATTFRLPWVDVERVIASPSTKTCFVDGGDPAKSLIVPGDGAPAPYDIDDKAGLYDAIMSRVSKDKVHEVETLEAAKNEPAKAP